MTRDEAKKVIEKQERIVRVLFDRAGMMSAVFHYHGMHGTRILAPPADDFDSDIGKDFIAWVVREMLKKERAEWVLYISEAWMLVLDSPNAEIPEQRPRDHPDRIEVVLYQLEDADAGIVSANQRITRTGGKPILGPLRFDPDQMVSIGRFQDLLPRKGRVN